MKIFRLLLCLFACLCMLISCSDSQENDNSSSDEDYNNQGDNGSSDNTANDTREPLSFQTTQIGVQYYCGLNAGEYLGNDLPNEIGSYYKKIDSYDEFESVAQNPTIIDPSAFEGGFVLVIKRVTMGYFSDIGWRDYLSGSITLDVYTSIMQGNDAQKTRIDFIYIPYSDQAEEPSIGELRINYNYKYYNELHTIEADLAVDSQNAWFFEDRVTASEFLSNINVSFNPSNIDNDCGILMIYMHSPLAGFVDMPTESYILGFNNFHSNENNVYITLERCIINENTQPSSVGKLYIIEIDNESICNDISENPLVHLLICDNKLNIQ